MCTFRVKVERFAGKENPLQAAEEWYASRTGFDVADVVAEYENSSKKYILLTVFDFDQDSEEDGAAGVLYY